MSEYPLGTAATLAELDGDPHPLLARLRASEPVSWVRVLGGWLVTRHDLALRVLRDAAAFTVDDLRFSTAQVVGPSMLSPADVRARFAGFVAAEVDRLIAGMRPAHAAELRRTFAGPLPVAVVAEALGLQNADATTIRSWYQAFVDAISDITAGRPADAAAADAFAMLRSGVEAALRDRRRCSLLATAAGTGGLTAAEVVSNAAVLMFGGIDTTEGMIANAAMHLLTNRAALEQVRADPELLASAIEESARLEPAASVVDRYATRNVTLAGTPIRRGDLVRVSLAGANRDPAVFRYPDRFDIRRENIRLHLAFARGPHFCFGAHLARLETQTAIRGLLDRLPGLRLDPARWPAARGLVFRKPPALHVRWD